MKKWCRTFLLSCLLCLSLCTLARAADGETLRVGLKYGSDAMSAANLQNYSAFGGYALGYFDADGSFEELGALPQLCEKITVTTDTTYHVQLSGTFYDYDDASRTAAQYSGGFVAYEDGDFYVRVGNYTSLSAARSAMAQYGGTAVGGSSTGVTVIVTGTDTILFEFDCGGSENLGILPIETREKTVTWFRGYRYYGGFEYQRTTGGYISVINVLDIEDYVKCVIAAEMSNDWPLEALKAQTVCARTYAASQTRHRSAGFDVCSTTDCQAYRGAALSNERSDAAAEETRGVYLYYNGELVTNAVYYSCNGGASESCKNVWGSEVPYLQGKLDPYEASVAWRFSRYYWSFTATGDELREVLKSEANTDIGQVQNVYVSEYSDTGNVIAITYEGTRGSYTARREKCRTLLNGVYDHINVRSMRYTVTGGDASTYYVNDAQSTVTGTGGLYVIDGDGTVTPNNAGAKDTYVITSGGVQSLERKSANTSNTFTFSGSGWGHNVGMSQWGAFAMAEQGYTYRDILNFYYTGITLS